MESGTNPFFVEQQSNVMGMGLPPLTDNAPTSNAPDMMNFDQNDSFPFGQDIPLPSLGTIPHYVMHPIQPFKVGGKSNQGIQFAPSPPVLSLNPQQFFHPSHMINNANGATPTFFGTPGVPPATALTSPITVSISPTTINPSSTKEKELATLLSQEGGITVVDRVPIFKELMMAGSEDMHAMQLAVLLNKHTTKACLKRFVEEEGVNVLHTWLTEARKAFPKRRKYLLQILDALAILPISLEALKKSQLGKTVKTLSKLNDSEISDKSQKLITSWMGLVAPQEQSTTSAVASASPSPSADSRKRSLVESDPLASKKKTKMIMIKEDSKAKPLSQPPTTTTTATKPPTTPPKPSSTLPSQGPLGGSGSKLKPPAKISQSTTSASPPSTPVSSYSSQAGLQQEDEKSKPSKPTSSDDFMSQLSSSSKKVASTTATTTKKKGALGHRMQLIELAVPPKKVVKSAYDSKPLSADAIHKAKLKEMLLTRSSDNTPPTSPPTFPSPPSPPPPPPPPHSPPPSSPSVPSSPSAHSPITSPNELPSNAPFLSRVHPDSFTPTPLPSYPPVPSYDSGTSVDTHMDPGIYIEKEPDPNRRKSTIKNPRVSWASDEKLLEVREYIVDEEPLASSGGISSDAIPVNPSQAEQHRSFESARLHELQQERSIFMHMKGEEDSWRTAYQEMRPREGLAWPRRHLFVEFPAEFKPPKRGEDSEEVKVQRLREAQELMVIYKDKRMAPDSPREPAIIESDYDDSKTTIIVWDEATPSSPPATSLFNPLQQQLQQQQPSTGVEATNLQAILSLLGGQQFPNSNPNGVDPNDINSSSTNSNINTNPNTPGLNHFNTNFMGNKPNFPDNQESMDLPNKLGNPNSLLPSNLGNLKNFGLFNNMNNFGNLGNLLSQFPNQLGLLNQGMKLNTNDPSIMSAMGGGSYFGNNTMNDRMNDRGMNMGDRMNERGMNMNMNMNMNDRMNDRNKYGRMCTFFNTPQGCRNGNQCKFAHVQPIHPSDFHPDSANVENLSHPS